MPHSNPNDREMSEKYKAMSRQEKIKSVYDMLEVYATVVGREVINNRMGHCPTCQRNFNITVRTAQLLRVLFNRLIDQSILFPEGSQN